MVKLSSYIYNTVSRLGREFNTLDIVPVTRDGTFEIGNLVLREYYISNNKGYTYCKETMIVTGIHNNDYLGLQLQTVVEIEDNRAIVTDQTENVFYYNDRWFNTLDEKEPTSLQDDSIRCEQLVSINISDAVGRTYISNNYYYEENGFLKGGIAPKMNAPKWCDMGRD